MKPLIVGIDPGTTSAAAGVNFDGELEFLFSERHISTAELIEKIIENGKPVIIASDKSKTPSKVGKIASSVGAELFEPRKDLSQEEKAEKGSGDNYHEIDASAAAFNAFNKSRKQIRKIREIAESKDIDLIKASKIYYQDTVIEESGGDEVSEEAENENPDTTESIESRLRRKIERLESEIDRLEGEKKELIEENSRLENKIEGLREKNREEIESSELKKKESALARKDREIDSLETSLESSMSIIKAYRKGMKKIYEGSELLPIADEINEIQDKAAYRSEEVKKDDRLENVELWDVEEIKGIELKDFIIVDDFPEKNFKDVIKDYRESR